MITTANGSRQNIGNRKKAQSHLGSRTKTSTNGLFLTQGILLSIIKIEQQEAADKKLSIIEQQTRGQSNEATKQATKPDNYNMCCSCWTNSCGELANSIDAQRDIKRHRNTK
jgi:hypothetical protein